MQQDCSEDLEALEVDQCKRDTVDVNFSRFEDLLDQLGALFRARCAEKIRMQDRVSGAEKVRMQSLISGAKDPVESIIDEIELKDGRCTRFQELLHQLAAEYKDLCETVMEPKKPLMMETTEVSLKKLELLRETTDDGENVFDFPGPDQVEFRPIGSNQSASSMQAEPSIVASMCEPGRNQALFQANPTKSFISSSAEPIEEIIGNDGLVTKPSSWSNWSAPMRLFIGHGKNSAIIRGSALGLRKSLQCVVWLVALAGVVFVLWATTVKLGGDADSHEVESSDCASADDEHHRRLGAGASDMLRHIAYALTGAGLMAIVMNSLKQPLILGYLLGGVLVGPEMGLGLVGDHKDISQISSLGLIFLLFMIGLELNVMELLRMGKVVLATGALQFPICAGTMLAVFMGMNALGLSFGKGDYSTMYCGLTCGISSTMIVVKLLSEKGETESRAGRLTVGILIFQDIWAIIVLAIQPKIANPEIVGILKTFGWIAALIFVAMCYAKFVMPAVFVFASQNVELMLVLSLSWCFFICCFAILPLVGLSMELAALVAGITLAAFPYSAEFNGKIKYIRDFFITLFFVALGMQIPAPTFDAVLNGMIVACVVVVVRWLGICCVVLLMGGGPRLAILSTLNLSQISEFALVICKLGQDYGHIDEETMTVIIWTFAILAVSASYIIGFNQAIFKFINGRARLIARQSTPHGEDEEERNVVFLGFHRVAYELVSECQRNNPQMLKKLHVIDVDSAIMPKLRAKGIKCSYGDISSADVLEHLHHGGEENLVISTIPDSALQGITNAQLLRVAQHVFPKAHYICTADNPSQEKQLYTAGAHYVIGMARLSAERLHDMLAEHYTHAFGVGELFDIFESYRSKDTTRRGEGSNHSLRISL